MAPGIPGRSGLAALGARLGLALAFGVIALLLALAGLGLLVAALYLWLSTIVPPAAAALIAGAVVLLLAGLIALIGRLVVRVRLAPRVHLAGVAGAPLPGVATMVGSELGVAGMTWLRGHLPQVAVAALAAGFVLGVSPRLRNAIWRQLQ